MKALVTGGTRGIGKAIAEALQAGGHDVTVTGTTKEGKAPKGCRYLPCDFSRDEETGAFCAKIEKDDWSILVNNAGINKIGHVDGYDPSDFQTIQKVNVTAPYRICQAVLPGMKKNKYGRILNITSIFGVVSKEGLFT